MTTINNLDWADLKEVLLEEFPEANYDSITKIVELMAGIFENKLNQKIKKQKVPIPALGKAVMK